MAFLRRFFYTLLTAPLLLAFIVFTVSNRATLTINLWPFPYEIAAPTYAIILGGIFLGFILGSFGMYASMHRWKRQAKVSNKQLNKLRKNLSKPLITA